MLSGTQIDKKINEIWQKESKKPDWNEAICCKAMVMAFQAELMAHAGC